MRKQRTVKKKIKAQGVCLHTGQQAHLTICPAPVNTGIVFKRVDFPVPVNILGSSENVGETMLSTTLQRGDVKISTVEHLMSAFAGLGIDNAYVEVDAPEIPIMDGSAAPFVFLLQSAGIQEQEELKRFIRIKREIMVRDKDKWAKLEPYDGFKVTLSIDFAHPYFEDKPQKAVLDFSSISYVKEVARARTFGFLAEYEYLRSRNLALGGNLYNALVINGKDLLNEGGLRLRDEVVMHKVLDAVGDLYLLRHSLLGAYEAYKPGHALNNQLCRALLANPDAFEEVTFASEKLLPVSYRQNNEQVA